MPPGCEICAGILVVMKHSLPAGSPLGPARPVTPIPCGVFSSLAVSTARPGALTIDRDDLVVGAVGVAFMLLVLWLVIRDAAKAGDRGSEGGAGGPLGV